MMAIEPGQSVEMSGTYRTSGVAGFSSETRAEVLDWGAASIGFIEVRHWSMPAPTPTVELSELARTFRGLALTWIEETADSSLIQKRIRHRVYQQIIGLGPQALPLILRELRRQPDYWFWALHCISREDPVRPNATFQQAATDWLNWGRSKGLIE